MKNVKANSQENTAEQALSKLSLEQKIALCSGLNEWDTKAMKTKEGEVDVPSVKVADGPHGLRKTVGQGDNLGLSKSEPATCFPAESLLACSFDRDLARRMGQAIAKEALCAGVCTVLGPGVNIKRNPLCGRNFEYLSEDPYLAGRMAASYIDGVQGEGIGTSIKHFACNSQEHFRMLSDSRLDERTLREIYLSAFEYAIKQSRPATVMCAYNKVNGTYCSDNAFLLDTVLRKEWGYEGMVVSDWGAINNRVEAFKAGCDLVMPGGSAYGEDDVKSAVEAGELDEALVDRSASRVAAFALGRSKALLDNEGHRAKTPEQIAMMHEQSHAAAQEIAEGSAVLMKNNNGLLPFDDFENESVCVIGAMAQNFRYQGSGSSKINAVKVDGVLEALGNLPYEPGYNMDGKANDGLFDSAVELAGKSGNVIVFAGLPEKFEAEGIDRRTMSLPAEQNRLIERIAEVNPNVVVVLVCGCAVELPWADKVGSILWMGLSGQAGASALVRILKGEVNPSGKLAESWPIAYGDCPSSQFYLKDGRDAVYREGLYIGYRHYDKNRIPVRFPFGHGLGYTTFEYSDLVIEALGGCAYEVSVRVTNTGDRAGSEAVLLFIHAPQDGIDRPARELKGFDKVHLKAGESTVVKFATDERSFAVWKDGWKVYGGEYAFEIGSLVKSVAVEGLEYDGSAQTKAVAEVAEKPSNPYTVNSTISEVAQDVSLLKLAYRWFENKQARTNGRGSADYLAAMSALNECPLRAVQNFVGFKHHFAQAIADFGNGHYLKGLKHMFR